MARGVNKVILVGNLGRDPEIRHTAAGDAIVNFSLATADQWKDKNGEKQERTEWHRCVAYRKLAEIIGEYARKGTQAYVEGKLQTRKWQDQSGQDRWSTEISVRDFQMLGSRSGTASFARDDSQQPRDYAERGRGDGHGSPGGNAGFDDFDDDIPF